MQQEEGGGGRREEGGAVTRVPFLPPTTHQSVTGAQFAILFEYFGHLSFFSTGQTRLSDFFCQTKLKGKAYSSNINCADACTLYIPELNSEDFQCLR